MNELDVAIFQLLRDLGYRLDLNAQSHQKAVTTFKETLRNITKYHNSKP